MAAAQAVRVLAPVAARHDLQIEEVLHLGQRERAALIVHLADGRRNGWRQRRGGPVLERTHVPTRQGDAADRAQHEDDDGNQEAAAEQRQQQRQHNTAPNAGARPGQHAFAHGLPLRLQAADGRTHLALQIVQRNAIGDALDCVGGCGGRIGHIVA